MAKTQIYCGKKVIAELTRDLDSLASIQETFKNVVLHITSRKMHANVDVLLETVKLLICWILKPGAKVPALKLPAELSV